MAVYSWWWCNGAYNMCDLLCGAGGGDMYDWLFGAGAYDICGSGAYHLYICLCSDGGSKCMDGCVLMVHMYS